MRLLGMLKQAWGCTHVPHPLVEYIVNVQPVSVQIRDIVAAEKGYDHVSASLEYQRGGRSEMDRDPEVTQSFNRKYRFSLDMC